MPTDTRAFPTMLSFHKLVHHEMHSELPGLMFWQRLEVNRT